ncbi:Tat pathway signal sequence [Favolaschia claudopus]|uniref:Tat pathway signal sequence n=1 Tax=Favolaschia claudopus TaxID=2862362 RepID=A0AAW0DM52_9AGAR
MPLDSYHLLPKDELDSEQSVPFLPEQQAKPSAARTWITRISLSLNVLFVAVSLVLLSRRSIRSPPHSVSAIPEFAPEKAFGYSRQLFKHPLSASPTKYQGYGLQVDKAWHELYASISPTILTENEAKQLPNWTQPLNVDGEMQYSVEFAVFHDLHCLNLARMSLYPDHYNSPAIKRSTTVGHLSHCFDMLRQAIQCAADMTPTPLRYGHWEGDYLVNNAANVEHVCRDWDMVVEWVSKPERRVSPGYVKALEDARKVGGPEEAV